MCIHVGVKREEAKCGTVEEDNKDAASFGAPSTGEGGLCTCVYQVEKREEDVEYGTVEEDNKDTASFGAPSTGEGGLCV